MKPRALISVSDKNGIVEFARELVGLGYEVVSTGGTLSLLAKEGVDATSVDSITDFPECLGGRVKTLHPKVHGGILYIRDNEEHVETIKKLGIGAIDIVVVNLYPFKEVIGRENHSLAEAIENIDIGGPSMIRAAAKNYPYVAIITDKNDYAAVIGNIKSGKMDKEYRLNLAKKAFAHTAQYDSIISTYLNNLDGNDLYPESLTLTFEKKENLRYGENPHQSAAYYTEVLSEGSGIESAEFLHGKELSYNNINDAQGAVDLAKEFTVPVCVAVKHATPCGVAIGESSLETFAKAFEADPVSIFGGIVAFNTVVDLATAEKLHEVFLEVIIAPEYTADALVKLSSKKNLRLLKLDSLAIGSENTVGRVFKNVGGGLLIQQGDSSMVKDESKTVTTKTAPNSDQLTDLNFGMTVVKHIKSNAIVLVKNGQTVGVGGGNVSRIGAVETAIKLAGDKARGAVLASDAFFPFPDVVEAAAKAGITAIIQPGGSKNDQLSIDKCDELGIPMIFTGVRHFRH